MTNWKIEKNKKIQCLHFSPEVVEYHGFLDMKWGKFPSWVIQDIYIAQGENVMFEWALEYLPKYYSDHDGLCLTLWEDYEAQ